MPKIEINEYDETRQAALAETTDVVYVPGFVNVNSEDLNQDGEYKGIKQYTPTLFTEVTTFENACGKIGVRFEEDQLYSSVASILPDGSEGGFDQDAVPFNGVMFNAGEYDPGYIMAKELLASGLPVLFERVNPDKALSNPISTEPDNWAVVFNEYVHMINIYDRIKSSTAPLFFFESANGLPKQEETSYFKRTVEVNENGDITGWKFISVDSGDVNTDSNGNVVDITGQKKEEDNSVYFYKKPDAPKYFWFKPTTLKADGEDPFDAGKDVETPAFESGKYYDATDVVPYFSAIEGNDWKTLGKVPGNIVYEKIELNGEADGGKDYFKKDGNDYIISLKWVQDYAGQDFRVYVKTQVDATSTWDASDDQVYFKKLSGTTIKDMYNALSSMVYDTSQQDRLVDKGNYSIKYITSGGYPVYEYNNGELVTKMKRLAYERGDCVALIDHTFMPERNMNIDQPDSLYNAVTHDASFTSSPESSYAAMFTPWCKYTRITSDVVSSNSDVTPVTEIKMPASFAYLTSLADSIKTYANWMAVAGVTRGMVQHLASDGIITDIPNGVADKMSTEDNSGIYINPITNVRPYGNVIWGNRTLLKNEDKTSTQATSFLSIRNLISDIKKLCYTVCRRLTFEPNSNQLWTNIQAGIMPTLDRMQSGYGISGYQLAINKEHPEYGRHATFCFKIILYPVYPVERFYVNVILRDNEVTFE